MYALVVIATVACLAAADVSHLGYQYKVPQTSYGVPAYQQSGNNDYNAGSGSTYKEQTLNHGFQGQGLNQDSYQGSGFGVQSTGGQAGWSSNQGSGFGQQNGGYQGAGFGQQNTGYNTGYLTHVGTGSSGAGHQVSSGNPGQFYHASSNAGYFGGYQSSSQSHGSAGITVQQQPTQVFKHVYVHEAPEEPEQPRVRQQVVLPAPQKHYKIIFIKAPTSTVYAPKYIPVPQQNEEKTIVYVLSKKTEELHDEVVPQIEAKPPAKPDVFFVKYQNKEDSQAVINNIVQDYQKGGSQEYAGATGGSGSGGYFTQNDGAFQGTQQSGGSHVGGSGLYTQAQPSQSQYNAGSAQYPHADVVASSGAAQQSSGGFSHGVSGLEGTVDTLTSQGVPHTSYGTPFRA